MNRRTIRNAGNWNLEKSQRDAQPWPKRAALTLGTLMYVIVTALVVVAQPLPVGEIVFVSDLGGDSDIYLVNAGGGAPQVLIDSPEYDVFPCLSPDRSRIAYTQSITQPPLVISGNVRLYSRSGGFSARLTRDGDAQAVAWSPDGTWLAIDGHFGLGIINVSNGSRETLVPHIFADRPSWTPDGLRIVYHLSNHSVSGTVTSDGLFVVDLATRSSVKVLDFGFNPAVSPDGTRIAFGHSQNGNSDIYLVNIDGTGLVNVTADSLAAEWGPTWSPNGGFIAFVTDRDGNYEIYRMDADGANPVNLTNLPDSAESQPDWR